MRRKSLQGVSETRVSKLNSIWSLAAQIETSTLARSTEFLKHLSSEIPRNEPHLDSMMFARHNAANWQEPADFSFEPSPVWHDDDAIVADEAAKNFLRNILTRSKGQLRELRRDSDGKRREVENAKRVRESVKAGKDNRDEVEVVRAIFTLQEALHEVDRQRVTAEVEVSVITTSVGDVSIGARNHNFKSQTFKIPTNCDYCGDRIWGLSAKGLVCQDCGYTCHIKCQMKIPADCPGEQSKEEKKRLKQERQEAQSKTVNGLAEMPGESLPSLSRQDTVNSMNTLSSGYSANAQRSISGSMNSPAELDGTPANGSARPISTAGTLKKHRVVAPPPAHYVSESSSNEQRGKMMFPYQVNGDGEISVDEGREITVVEPDGTCLSHANLDVKPLIWMSQMAQAG